MKLIGVCQKEIVQRERGETLDALDRRWIPLLAEHNLLPLALPNCPKTLAAYLSSLCFEGFLLSGGNNLAASGSSDELSFERDACEGQIIAHATAQSLPLLGVCRGMQALAVYHGGQIQKGEDHSSGRKHRLRCQVHPALKLPAVIEVNSYHNFQVSRDALADFDVVARADDDSVEAIAHKTKRLYGIMWHPERPPFSDYNIDVLRGVFL